MNCFEQIGMEVPDKRGGKCQCGAVVRFDIVTRRIEHFVVCPVVDQIIASAQADIEVDEEAVRIGLAAFGGV